ncbi:hypothetical protein YK56LOC_31650 [Caballeronia sp. HLA56]
MIQLRQVFGSYVIPRTWEIVEAGIVGPPDVEKLTRDQPGFTFIRIQKATKTGARSLLVVVASPLRREHRAEWPRVAGEWQRDWRDREALSVYVGDSATNHELERDVAARENSKVAIRLSPTTGGSD